MLVPHTYFITFRRSLVSPELW